MNADSTAAAVIFDQVSKAYGPVPAIRELSFSIATGQIVALLGLNGAGKSTAVDLMLGLRRADLGQVTVLGGSPAAAVASRRVSALLQTGSLPIGAKVRESVDLARRLYGKKRTLAQALELAGLSDLADHRCDALSGGQRQRVRFGMAIAGRPELMFLDEPTVALDIAARAQFWSTMRTVADEGTTIVFATHYLHEADEVADSILLLDAGTLAARGTPEQVKAGVASKLIGFRADAPDRTWLAALDGVLDAEIDGDAVRLRCGDADQVLAQLYRRYGRLREVTVTSGGLADAVLALAPTPQPQIHTEPARAAARSAPRSPSPASN